MYGVILWSDTADRKAVIWCEDQAALAYLDETGKRTPFCETGDLIQFEMAERNGVRVATQAQMVGPELYRDLPESLRKAVPDDASTSARDLPALRLVATGAGAAAPAAFAASTENPFNIVDEADEDANASDDEETFAREDAAVDRTNVVAFRFGTKKRIAS